MDAFYASVEILDNPSLKGKAVVVGGSPDGRGVVCAASYEARKYGVHSALPCSRAIRLCPDAIFIRPRFNRYREISGHIHDIFRQYTDILETLALDEAWLDVSINHKGEPSATILAQQIKAQILEDVGLTCSAGVSYNKFLAKIASDENKPNGIFIIPPNRASVFLEQLHVKKIPGVGKVTAKKLAAEGIEWGYQLHEKTEEFLVKKFGKFGYTLYRRIRGIDDRPVKNRSKSKSISTENTFHDNLLFGVELSNRLTRLVSNLTKRCEKKSAWGRTITLKVKFSDFNQITRSGSFEHEIKDEEEIFTYCLSKLEEICLKEYPDKPIRLIGVGVSNFEKEKKSKNESVQLDFFQFLNAKVEDEQQ